MNAKSKTLDLIVASRIDSEGYQKLSAIADQQGINKAKLIRGILTNYLNEQETYNPAA